MRLKLDQKAVTQGNGLVEKRSYWLDNIRKLAGGISDGPKEVAEKPKKMDQAGLGY